MGVLAPTAARWRGGMLWPAAKRTSHSRSSHGSSLASKAPTREFSEASAGVSSWSPFFFFFPFFLDFLSLRDSSIWSSSHHLTVQGMRLHGYLWCYGLRGRSDSSCRLLPRLTSFETKQNLDIGIFCTDTGGGATERQTGVEVAAVEQQCRRRSVAGAKDPYVEILFGLKRGQARKKPT